MAIQYLDAFRFYIETGDRRSFAVQSLTIGTVTVIRALIAKGEIVSREIGNHERLHVIALDREGMAVLRWDIRYNPRNISLETGPFDNDLSEKLVETITLHNCQVSLPDGIPQD